EERGRGVAGRALRLITDWALDGLLLDRVELRIDVGNAPSIRVAERIGYRREGVLRSLHFKEDVRTDVAVYSLLAGDERWPDARPPRRPPWVGAEPLSPAADATGIDRTRPCRKRDLLLPRGIRNDARLGCSHGGRRRPTARPTARGDRDPARMGP